LQKEEKITDQKWEKEKHKQREEEILRELQMLSQEMDHKMQMAEYNLKKTSNVQKIKRQVKREKLKEIERDIKKDKMERMQNMFKKLDKQAKVMQQLKMNELDVRMHLKNKLY
jgi:hypothetical protein